MAGLGLGLELGNMQGNLTPWYTEGKADDVDPTLWADFVNNRYAVNGVSRSYSDIFTHTRASTATYFDASGVMQTAAVDTPRFDYDPVTLEPRGLLLEEQRTNLQLNSNTPFTTWTVVTATKTAAPSNFLGFTDGCEVASQGATWNRIQGLPFSWTSGVVYSWTAYVKAGIGGQIAIVLRDNIAATETRIVGALSGALTITTSLAGAATYTGSLAVQGGYIITGTFTPNATTISGLFGVGPNSATIGDSVIVYAGQFEAGAFPTSHIITAGSAVTRSQDTCVNSSANVVPFASWYNTALTTLYSEYLCINRGVTNGVASISNNSSTNRTLLRSNAGQSAGGIISGGVIGYLSGGFLVEPTSTFTKNTLAAELNNVIQYSNATAATLDTSCAMPVGVDRLIVGAGETTSSAIFSGNIKELRYYPIRVTNSELERITT
jgi:hypothetical protein